MAIDQDQVDKILSGTSSGDDPEEKLQELEQEVDFLKTSVKRLLIDIREKINEVENPFTLSAGAMDVPVPLPDNTELNEKNDEISELKDKLSEMESRTSASLDSESPLKDDQNTFGSVYPAGGQLNLAEGDILSALRAQVAATSEVSPSSADISEGQHEKLRLQKVHRLFEWTKRSVKKYGHDRLEMMLESYRAMGYITSEGCDQIKEISRLMPSSLGEAHEIGSDEFVTEIYYLNRILDPVDTSLDRDMIEVLMLKKTATPEDPLIGGEKKPSLKIPEEEPEWFEMTDRI